jgi:hypothetical protein
MRALALTTTNSEAAGLIADRAASKAAKRLSQSGLKSSTNR